MTVETGRRLRALRRLGLRPRRGGRRDGLPRRAAGAASRSAPRACRSSPARRCSISTTAATRPGAAARPMATSASRRRRSAGAEFALGTAGAGYGATTCDLKGGLGSASAVASARLRRRRAGRRQRGRAGDARRRRRISGRRPTSAAREFGGLGAGAPPTTRSTSRSRRDEPANTTLAVVATDARLTKAQTTRVAIMAHGRLRPRAAARQRADATATSSSLRRRRARRATPTLRDLTEIGALAAECVARSIARGVYEATPLPFAGALPSWKGRYGQ